MVKLINSNKGISLIEVVMAMLIVAIGILGLAPLMAITMDANSFSRSVSTANSLAQDKIESMRTVPSFSPLPFVESDLNVNNKFDIYTTIDGTASDASVPSGVYRIHVDIRWVDQNNLPRSLEYWTYRTK
ncbi:MAG: prepilin-type N-terminal cleavage/methylation domain-containing protein [candidate division Zixibacteria bacterium]|nr:prepilin-type N-terminal cleavage/methylation domain-containing protein [candidate division Zixibacteria bacterium]